MEFLARHRTQNTETHRWVGQLEESLLTVISPSNIVMPWEENSLLLWGHVNTARYTQFLQPTALRLIYEHLQEDKILVTEFYLNIKQSKHDICLDPFRFSQSSVTGNETKRGDSHETNLGKNQLF